MVTRILAAAVAAALLAGCASNGTENQASRQTTGAVIGAVTGAVLGHQIDRRGGAGVGAVVGGIAGGVIGHRMDEQEREFNRALEAEQRANEIEVERVREDLLKLTLQNEVSFDFDSARIRPDFKPTLDKLARVLDKYPGTDITIVGHTDSIGTESYNQRLSERRAEAVADYLVGEGVSRARLATRGRGELEPRADNATEAGRMQNRRVELFVQADPESPAYRDERGYRDDRGYPEDRRYDERNYPTGGRY